MAQAVSPSASRVLDFLKPDHNRTIRNDDSLAFSHPLLKNCAPTAVSSSSDAFAPNLEAAIEWIHVRLNYLSL
jgi:hypothetical protein